MCHRMMSYIMTWYHMIFYKIRLPTLQHGQEHIECQLLTQGECLTPAGCFTPMANMNPRKVQQQKQLRNTWATRCRCQAVQISQCQVWRLDQLVEMLMPRSSVRSMCATSPAGRSIEKFVKTQLPGRAAICCSWSEAFNCWAPLDMRRLPCHGPGLCKAAKLQKTIWSMSLIIVLVGYMTLELVPKKPSTIWQSWASASSTVASKGLGNLGTEHICAVSMPRRS